MCRTWVKNVFACGLGLVNILSLVSHSAGAVYNQLVYTSSVTSLYKSYTSKKSTVLDLLNDMFYTLYTAPIITRVFLSNLFFIINNMGVKV